MIAAPGLTPRRTSLPAHQVDILPTVLALVGLPQPELRDGMNLTSITDVSQHKERPILSHRSEPQSGKELWSLLIGDWRLTDEQPTGEITLFKISEDPTEKVDLADAHPEKTAAMSERLNAIRDSLSPLPRNKVQVDLTYRLNMELRRLGYVGEEEDE
jgi:arylsulfatase A-like enzyme